VAIFLNELQAGTDPDMIGFPNLMMCMGFVVQTGAHLYGFHFDNPNYTAAEAPIFAEFLKTRGCDMVNAVAIYGASNWPQRYMNKADPQKEWQDEMQLIAGILGYTGVARGFDATIITSTEIGRYVEYRPQYHKRKCKIFWKVQNNQDFTGTAISPKEVAEQAHRSLRHHRVHNFGTPSCVPAKPGDNVRVPFTTGFADTGGRGRGATLAQLDYGQRLLEFTV
jgi:hypothetical protein